MVSIFTLSLLALARFFIVNSSLPPHGNTHSTGVGFNRRDIAVKTGLAIGAVWLSAAFIAFPPVFGWGRIVPDPSGLTCAADWACEANLSYAAYMFGFGFFIPLFVIIPSNCLVVRKMKKVIFLIIRKTSVNS